MSSEKENTYADAGNMPQTQIGPARLLHQPPGNQRAANLACLSKEMPQKLRAKEAVGRRSSGETAGRRSSGGVSQKHLGKATLPGMSLSGEMLQKQMGKVNASLMPQKHREEETMGACYSSGVSHKHLGKVVSPGMGLHREMLPKQRKKKVDMGLMPQNQGAKEMMCPPDQLRQHPSSIQGAVNITKAGVAREKHSRSSTSFPRKSATPQLKTRSSSRCSNSGARRPVDGHDHGNTATQESRESAAINIAKEADDAIQKLNELRLGEDISFEEYRGYLMLLPWDPHVDTSAKMDCAERFLMKIRHAKYRIRSYKLSQKVSKNDLHNTEMKVYCPMDLLDKEEFTPNFLMKMQFFTCLEDDGILDWFFHSDLCMLAGLNDYQRLVPQNHGDCEYADWDEYRNYFHSHEMQREYVEYFKILLRELKWLEKCLHFKPSSRIGDIICTRGIYQATKIATGFSKITGSLAYIGFYECLNYISNETTWCEGSDGLYFEIWKRVTQQEKSFRSALEEVYLLNKFPLRQDSMKFALEDDCSFMKSEFHTCTAGITKEDSEDKAQELITEAVKKLRTKPKFYDQYIRKKLDIAQSIGLISTD